MFCLTQATNNEQQTDNVTIEHGMLGTEIESTSVQGYQELLPERGII